MSGRLVRMFLAAMIAAAGPAVAADGSALGVDSGAVVRAGAEVKILRVGSDLFIGDKVETDASGLVQIRFADTTELVVGPNSALVLEDYLLRADGSSGNFAVNALTGTFRFVTGNAPKERYAINTPSGTIGIRGTAFDFTVTAGTTNVLLYHGAATLCARAAKCATLSDTCQVGRFDRKQSEVLGDTGSVDARTRATLRAGFLYAVSQRPLLREFRVRSAEKCLRRTVADTVRVTGSSTGSSEVNPPSSAPPPSSPPPSSPPPSSPPSTGGDDPHHDGKHAGKTSPGHTKEHPGKGKGLTKRSGD
ncbi:FecR family protein [Devosia sp.]|uniref:FecR family protein n=1 Tax=Devosia sp. TaxID=1871048 RepID=UPI003A8CB72B